MTAPSDPAERTARAALAALAGTREIADAPFSALHGGLSNHAWRADCADGSYFVRLGGRGSERLGVDRRSECLLLGAVSAAGLAPGVLVCDPGRDLLVTRFVSAEGWTREAARETSNLCRIGKALRTLHALSLCPGVRRVSFAAQVEFLEGQLDAGGIRQPALRRIATSAFETLSAREPVAALCHNDLHHLNILDDGDRLWLVDWEYGGCGDPLFDLASFLCQHESTPQERGVLLEAYRGGAAMSCGHVQAACNAFDYVQWLWYRLRAASEPGEAGEHSARAAHISDRLLAAR